MSACSSCRAPIIWTTNVKTSRRMPVDRDPVPHGNVLLLTGNSEAPESRVLTKDELAKRAARLDGKPDLHVSHFATCPAAAQHRRK